MATLDVAVRAASTFNRTLRQRSGMSEQASPW